MSADILMTFRGMTVSSCSGNLQKKNGGSDNTLNLCSECAPFPVLAKTLIILIGFSWFSFDDPDKFCYSSSH